MSNESRSDKPALVSRAVNRRSVLLGGTTLAVSAAGGGAPIKVARSQQPAQINAAHPNIVFILMDNLGYGEPGCFGGGITRGASTPRIDRLSAEGTRLTNFNVEAQCRPSHWAIMTGRFSIRSGTHSIPIGGGLEGLTQWEVAIAKLLSGAGYATGHFGKWHPAIDFIRRQVRADTPFFCWSTRRARISSPMCGPSTATSPG